jgi:uncharacterized protein YxjI
MRYIVASKWSLLPQFTVTDQAGAPVFEVRHGPGLRRQLSIRDQAGREVAGIRKRGMGGRYEILAGGAVAGEVRHQGVFGQHYQADSSAGPITAEGSFTGRHFALSRLGQPVATVVRERALREKLTVDIADGEDQVYVLAVVLAIDAIREDRSRATAGG